MYYVPGTGTWYGSGPRAASVVNLMYCTILYCGLVQVCYTREVARDIFRQALQYSRIAGIGFKLREFTAQGRSWLHSFRNSETHTWPRYRAAHDVARKPGRKATHARSASHMRKSADVESLIPLQSRGRGWGITILIMFDNL